MATPIVMPRLGMSMREGRVVAWPVEPGERVAKGCPVVVIESEKAEVEVEAIASGVLRHVYVPAGETVPCGTLLGAIVEDPDEAFDAEAFRRTHERVDGSAVARAPRERAAAPRAGGAASGPAGAGGRGLAGAPISPAARARARALGLDPSQVAGTGPGGRVTREDVEAHAARLATRVEVAPGVALEVLVEGRGDPVLLLPGFGSDVAAFARQTPGLAERHRVIGVNPRGVGASGDAAGGERHDPATMAADALAAADARTPEAARLHLLGASLGAAVAIELALAHPERVRSLVLVTPFLVASPRLLAVLETWRRLGGQVAPAELAAALLPWLLGAETLADAGARARFERGLAAMAARVPAATLARQAEGLRAWSGRRSASDLARLAAPVLVIAGGEDLLVPDAPALAAAILGAQCVRVDGAGHAVALEAPEAVNAALAAHLAAAG